ncbi:MAG: transposase [Rhodospirillales bacterium]
MASVFTRLFGLAMRVEREQFLGAGHYDRVSRRRVYANGYKSKRVDTPAGALSVSVSKTSDHLQGCSKQFFLQSMERRRRFSPAVILAVAVMYIKGISTRDAEAVMKEFGIESLTSTQISRVKNFWLMSYQPSTTDPRAKYAI